VALESLGPINDMGLELLQELGRRMTEAYECPWVDSLKGHYINVQFHYITFYLNQLQLNILTFARKYIIRAHYSP